MWYYDAHLKKVAFLIPPNTLIGSDEEVPGLKPDENDNQIHNLPNFVDDVPILLDL